MVQGTVYDTIFGVSIAIAAYKWIGYDFAVFGNHEFNKGPDPIFETVLNTPELTWISSNVNFTTAPPGFHINTAVELYNICWVSVLTTATNDASSPGPDTFITNERRGIKKAIRSCSQRKNVIAINHQGFDEDVKMCREIRELDLIIGAHTHTNLNNGNYPYKVVRKDGSICWVTQVFAFGRYVGMLDVSFDTDGVINFDGHAYMPLNYRIKNDPEIVNQLAAFTTVLDKRVKEVVAETTDVMIGGNPCRRGECQMGNMGCDALMDQASGQGAEVCIMNGGSFRADIAKGDVSVEDVLNVFPFGNVHYVITLPGTGVIQSLEHGFTAFDSEDNAGRFAQVAGMVVEADINNASGSRVKSVKIGGVEIDPSKMYKVVTNSFIGEGGDGFTWPGATNFETSGRALNEIIQDYLTANSPYTPFIEGRIVDART